MKTQGFLWNHKQVPRSSGSGGNTSMRSIIQGWACLLAGGLVAQTPPPPPVPPAEPRPWPTQVPPRGAGWRVENRIEPLAPGARLLVRNRNGSIRVEGWDREEVRLQAEIRDSDRRRVDVSLQRRGADLEIDAQFQQSSWGFSFGFVATPLCEMTLQVPRKVLGYFVTKNGSVLLRNAEGFARLEALNGDVRVRDFAGELWAESTNGDVEARRLKARVRCNTTSGLIYLEDVEGGIQARSISGFIKARRLDGWGEGISLVTGSGSMDVELGRAAGELFARSGQGTIDVKVPGAQNVESDAHVMRCRIPGRTQKITLESTSGRVRIRQ